MGLLFMFGFGGWMGAIKMRDEIRTREDRVAIQNLVTELGDKSKAGDVQGLYSLFSGRFHDRVKFPRSFPGADQISARRARLRQTQSADTGLMVFDKDESTGTQFALVHVGFDFEKTDHPMPDDLTVKKRGIIGVLKCLQRCSTPSARQ